METINLKPYQLSPEDKIRIANYDLYRTFFTSQSLVPHQLIKEFQNPTFIRDGIPATISKISADFLFGEKFTVKYTADEDDDSGIDIDGEVQSIIREFNDGIGLQRTLYEDAISNSYMGDSVLGVYMKNDCLYIQSINPRFFVPVVDPLDPKQIISYKFIYEYKVKNANTKIVSIYRLVKVDNGTTTTYTLWESKNAVNTSRIEPTIFNQVPLGTSGIGVGLPDEMDNVIGTFLEVHTPNVGMTDTIFGISDYAGLVSMFDELNVRLSRLSMTLDEHGDPKMVVPPGVLNENGDYVKGSTKIFEVSPQSGTPVEPHYIDWQSQLEQAFSFIDRLIAEIMRDAEIPLSFIGISDGGQAESGRALRFKLLRLLAKSARKMRYYETTIKKILYISLLLKGFKIDMLDFYEDLEVDFGDGLPFDPLDAANVIHLMRSSNAMSIEESVAMMGKTGQAAEDEVALIKDENTVVAPDHPAITMPTGPTMTANADEEVGEPTDEEDEPVQEEDAKRLTMITNANDETSTFVGTRPATTDGF